jgi:DNA-binding CsgD family transcriptional regulator/tetratricopeptide (TPR) repeat protein
MSTRELPDSRTGEPLLERELELSRIEALVKRAAGGAGGFLLIEGSSGIGKSRLLAEGARLAGGDGLDVLRARTGELEREYAWGTVLRLFESRFLRSGDESSDSLLRGRASLAAPLLAGHRPDSPELPSAQEFSLVHGLYWAVVNLCEERATALIVDDAQWADDHSLRFLIYLAQRLEDLPVVLLVAVRTGDADANSDLVDRLSALASEAILRPAELTVAATSEFLSAAGVPSEASPEFVRASWEVTRGNPFLLRELAAAVRQDLATDRATNPARLRDFAPQSVGRSVVARLRGFGEDALELARAAAILGEQPPLSRVARLAGLDLDQAVSATARLVDAELLTSVDPVCFAHPMIRSAITAEAPPGTRSRQQAVAAELLHMEGAAPEEIAPMLLSGAPVAESWAREVLHDAARTATRQGAPQTAVRYLRRALDISTPEDRRPAMLIDLGLAEASSGETTSLIHFEQALALIDDPVEEARALYALGYTLYRYGRHAEAADVFVRGQDLFEPRDPDLAMRFAGAAIAASWFGVGNTRASLSPEAAQLLNEAVAGIGTGQPPSHSERLLLAVAGGLRITHWGGPAEAAAQLARRALSGEEALRSDDMAGMAANAALLVLVSSGRAVEAQEAADTILEGASQRGDVLAFAEASALRAFAAYSQGRVSEAMADAKAAIEGTEQGWGTLVPIPHAILAHCLIERDEAGAADDLLVPLAGIEPSGARATMWGFFHWARGRLRYERGDPHGALEDFEECRRLFSADGMRTSSASCPWRRHAALAAAAAGDRQAGLDLLDEDLAISRDFGLSGQVAAALRTRADLTDDAEAGATLTEAIEGLEDAGMPLELARALTSYGSCLRRAGRRVDSRDPLRRAHDLAHQLGARALQTRAHDELLASGARPRRVSLSGVDALTPTERRVADLIARGLTNRQIAESLFVTINTIEWHVRHVYAKLGVATRAEFRSRYQPADVAPGET